MSVVSDERMERIIAVLHQWVVRNLSRKVYEGSFWWNIKPEFHNEALVRNQISTEEYAALCELKEREHQSPPRIQPELQSST